MFMVEQIGPLLGRTLVLVAHPDDETLGAGVLLQRMREPIVAFATDGAPRDRWFWSKYGSRAAYADLRRQEAEAALAVAGVKRFHFLANPNDRTRFVDQDLFLWIPEAMDKLEDLIARTQPEAILTHAYEGGHPDHDTCCFLATRLASQHNLPLWEFPLYHRSRVGVLTRQEFMNPVGNEVLLDGTVPEVELKKRMIAAHATQAATLAEFRASLERFRPMFAYDFSRPPHLGMLNYEAWQWPVTGSQLVCAFQCWFNSRVPQEIETSDPGVRTVA